MLKVTILATAFLVGGITGPESNTVMKSELIPEAIKGLNGCSFNVKELKDKIQIVEAFPDIKVQYVDAFPDIKVKWVDAFPDDCGEWQKVDAFPDIKIQIVDAFPDVKVQIVDAFPGVK